MVLGHTWFADPEAGIAEGLHTLLVVEELRIEELRTVVEEAHHILLVVEELRTEEHHIVVGEELHSLVVVGHHTEVVAEGNHLAEEDIDPVVGIDLVVDIGCNPKAHRTVVVHKTCSIT